jgi:hypothetical protein
LFSDFFIDYTEFAAALAGEEEKEWESLDNEPVFDEEEFQEFEEQRIEEIRDSFAKGKTVCKLTIWRKDLLWCTLDSWCKSKYKV